MTKNLLAETLGKLKREKKTPEDVKWVGSEEWGWTTWDQFAEVAGRTEYDSGYGGQKIAENLVVVGEDWWLERGEYDGSEWWDYKTLPVRPADRKEIKKLKMDHCWSSLGKEDEEGKE